MLKYSRKIYYYSIFATKVGDIGVVWNGFCKKEKIIEIFLPKPRRIMKNFIEKVYPGAAPDSTPLVDRICEQIEQFLKGRIIDFSLNNIDHSRLYNFQKKVLLLEKKIPYGWVSTYGRLANKLGKPGAARAVGQALARNPFPIIIPCHRTIRSDGSLGGFQGGLKLKRKLLELEGIAFNKRGKAIMKKVW